ncbi:MAG: SDR family NAD(P)-dependent oxidoreductase [Acutalibacteraceae bacterium]|nr:SDR family NAD(P)-dependent oxidoreductase [Acutalibacteraceae bacterium]
MKTAVITGASSGLGVEFALSIDKTRPEIEEIWLIARRQDRLEELAQKLNKKTRVLSLDITGDEDLKIYTDLLEKEKPDVKLLINNAGFGRLGDFCELSAEDSRQMLRLNCEAVTVITRLTLPFMSEKSEIINTCSIAAFAPNARMAVYSSTKAYIMSFSRALRFELKDKKINVIAVCPGPMDTEFLPVAGIAKGSSNTFDTLPRVNPKKMAEGSLKASKKGKGVYTNRIFYKFYRILAKLLPHSLVMKFCQT